MAEYNSKYTRKEIEETLDSLDSIDFDNFVTKKEVDELLFDINGYEYVDMGEVGIWAKYPIGVSDWNTWKNDILYFQWGDTEGYTVQQIEDGEKNFVWRSYKFGGDDRGGQTKYNSSDNLTILESEDDAAHVNMGGAWRMPTVEEFQKLVDLCDNKITTNYEGTGIAGTIFTLKNDSSKKLFIPKTGRYVANTVYGNDTYFWSNSREIEPRAYCFNNNLIDGWVRDIGCCVLGILNPAEKYLSKKEASETYQEKGDYATKEDLESKANDSEVVKRIQLPGYADVYPDSLGQIDLTAGDGIIYEVRGSDDTNLHVELDTDYIATREYVDTALSKIDPEVFIVVTELPNKPDEGNEKKIHIVQGEENEQSDNIYVEYLWVNEAWEKLGEFKPDVNLDNYVTKDDNFVYSEEVVDEDTFEDLDKVTRQELKEDLLKDMWEKYWIVNGIKFGYYDHEATDGKPYVGNDLRMTYDEALEIMRVALFRNPTNGQMTHYCYPKNNAKTLPPYLIQSYTVGNVYGLFGWCSSIEVVRVMNLYTGYSNMDTRVVSVNNTREFGYGCRQLREIRGVLQMPSSDTLNQHFYNCSADWINLESVWLHSISQSTNFKSSSKLKYDCLRYMVDNAANTQVITITVHKDIWDAMMGLKEGDFNGGSTSQWEELLTLASEKNISFATA